MAILKKINFGNGAHEIAKTIVTAKSGGVMSVAAPNGVTNSADENKDYQYELDVNVDGQTLVKSTSGEGQEAVTQLAVGTVPAEQVNVADSGNKFTATNVEAVLAELKDDIDSTGSAAKTYKIVEVATAEAANTSLKEYKVQVAVGSGAFADDTASATIVVPKDQHLKNVELVTEDDQQHKGQFLKFTYVMNDGNDRDVYVDVSAFLAESEFGDGLEVSNAGVVSVKLGQGLEFGGETGEGVKQSIKVKIDPTSETFLTVGANGVKLAGVQDAINAKVAALDKTDDAAVPGQYVAAIEETDGIVAVKTRANVSEAVLNNYAKGTAPASLDIVATDTINQALAKLEHQVDAAEAAAQSHHSVVAKDANARHLALGTSTNADGATVYTIGENDIASASDLNAEVTRAKNAETAIDSAVGLTKADDPSESRTWTPTTNYGGSTTSVKNNMQAIDTQLKTVSDNLANIKYNVNGTTLILSGITQDTSLTA